MIFCCCCLVRGVSPSLLCFVVFFCFGFFVWFSRCSFSSCCFFLCLLLVTLSGPPPISPAATPAPTPGTHADTHEPPRMPQQPHCSCAMMRSSARRHPGSSAAQPQRLVAKYWRRHAELPRVLLHRRGPRHAREVDGQGRWMRQRRGVDALLHAGVRRLVRLRPHVRVRRQRQEMPSSMATMR